MRITSMENVAPSDLNTGEQVVYILTKLFKREDTALRAAKLKTKKQNELRADLIKFLRDAIKLMNLKNKRNVTIKLDAKFYPTVLDVIKETWLTDFYHVDLLVPDTTIRSRRETILFLKRKI